MPALLALLLAAAPAASAGSVAGMYETSQMEMAGGLELRPDGTFRYALEYGAVSEQGEGKWQLEGTDVRLTSDPMPKAPQFEVVEDSPAPEGELYVTLAKPGFGDWTAPLRLAVWLQGFRQPFEMQAGEDGRVETRHTPVREILPFVPVYGPLSDAIPLSPERGHRLTLRFVPNDLGKARFQAEPLARDGDTLILNRYDAKIVFHPLPR